MEPLESSTSQSTNQVTLSERMRFKAAMMETKPSKKEDKELNQEELEYIQKMQKEIMRMQSLDEDLSQDEVEQRILQ
jgi:hypothetical protein